MLSRCWLVLVATYWTVTIGPSTGWAESSPALDELVARSRLIVFGRVELVDDQLLCRVVKVLKGEYSPTAFAHQPPTGYVNPLHAPFYDQLDAGEKVFLFYVDHHRPGDGRLDRPDLGVIVDNGRVTFPPVDHQPPSMTVKQFQRQIAALLLPLDVAPTPRDSWHLAGPWKLLLPAGYEHDVTFTHVKGNRYRMEPGVLTVAGLYELEGDRLVRVPNEEQPPLVYEWKFLSRHIVHLDKQPPKSRPADYDGAVLFRTQAAVP